MATPAEPRGALLTAPSDNTTRTPFKTPDITPAQITAIVGFIVTIAAAFGLDVSDSLRDALVQGGTALLIILPAVDAIIRHGRTKIAVAQIQSAADEAYMAANANAIPTIRRTEP